MTQNYIAYAIVATAAAVLLSSTARIGIAMLSKDNVAVDFDVQLAEDDLNFFDDEPATPIQRRKYSKDDAPILPMNQRKLAIKNGESGPHAVQDTIPALGQLHSQSRKLDKTKLPYKCGVIMYDHNIPGEAGDKLDKWIKDLVQSNEGGVSLIASKEYDSKASFINEVEQQIASIGPQDWKFIHTHNNGLAFASDTKILKSWRDTVAKQHGCQFISAAVFTDPLNHSIKHTKQYFTECDCSMEEFKTFIMVDVKPWSGELDQFLFNAVEEEGGTPMEVKDKVKSGMMVLKEHFDVVLIDGQGDFSEELLRITGWKNASGKVKKANVSDGELVYSKNLVSQFGKMSAKNGDADFIDAVNHVYHNSLGYLFDVAAQ